MRYDHVTRDLCYEVRDYRVTEFEMFWLSWPNKDTSLNTLALNMCVIYDSTGNVTYSDIITNPKRIM